ncbi:MAG: LuxR C-terminal-related transcriptional regulator [Treponema sp.]|jgi:LuxR family maltose regulon positive regulatory protein|nr:LuxR C-terminal-related transcriptional regulator [Treponema sp.]
MSGSVMYRDRPSFQRDSPYFERPRIAKILEAALQNPVVVAAAGQGYGKTSSIYFFLKNNSTVSLWVQLSENDNIRQRFWEKLCACVTLQSASLGNAMREIGFPDTERLFDHFFSLIDQRIRAKRRDPPIRYVLVYDDFHTITDPDMLRLFDRTLAFPFPDTTIILISHTEPQIKTLPLLSKGFLARITAEDLRFTPEEISAYFAWRGFKLSSRDRDSLYRDTEGWPQLLSLTAQNVETQGGWFRYSPELIRPHLFKAIEDSLFSSLNEKARKFLIKLSLTEQWPWELLGEMNELGRDLEKFSPFISYDSYLNGYRIHRLFIEFLKEKQGELSWEERREMYLKFARWCLKYNLLMDAAVYYEKARDYQGFISLYFSYPVLIPWETASFLLSIVERLLNDAGAAEGMERIAGTEGIAGTDREDLLYLHYALKPKLLTAMGRFEEAAAACRGAIAKFEVPPFNAANARILSSVYISLGFVQIFTCRFTKSYQFASCFEKGYGYARDYNIPADRNAGRGPISSYICQVGFPAEAGEFEEYLSNLGPAISLMEKYAGGFMAGGDSLGWCEYYYYRGELGEAENYARQAIIRARENHQAEVENRGLFFLLRIAIHSGNFSEIENLCRQIKAQSETGDFQNRLIICDMECAWFYAQTGSTALQGSSFWGSSEEGDSIYYPIETLVKAKCFFVEKQYREALEILGLWESRRAPQGCLVEKLEMSVLEAACHLRLNRRGKALKKLEEAWVLSAANGLDMPFIELGEDMRLLASAALEFLEDDLTFRIPREWLEATRSRAAAYGKMLAVAAGPAHPVSSPDSRIVLRRSEAAVLRALSLGLTREEIARREGISFHGVKEIIKNLYKKLGAVNRADAVRIAIDKGLLQNSRR